jgi:hypothetical protein
MTARLKLALVVTALAAVGISVALATRTSASEKGSLTRLSNNGRVVSLHGGALTRALGTRRASLLAVRGLRAYYRVNGKDGPCVAAGPAGDPGNLGTVQCPRGNFPTAERPVVDLSVYESTSHVRGEMSLYRVAGVAADGVAAVAFLRPDGSVALRVTVSGNVFASDAVPAGPIAGVVALDSGGKQLWRSP